MIMVIAAVAVVGVLMITMLSAAVDSSKWTDYQVEAFQVESAAETAVAMAASDLWTGFERQVENGGGGGMIGFQNYLESRGIGNQTESQAQANPSDHRNSVGMHRNSAGHYLVDGVDVETLSVRREDSFGTTRLFIDCGTSNRTAGNGEGVSDFRVQHVYEIGAAEWEGTDFALLSNNVNCLLCHTKVDSVERFYNQDPLAFGTHERVRLGSLESFHVRSDPDSSIAGAIYLGGDALLEDGSRITDWHALSLRAAEFDDAGLLKQDAWGSMTLANLNPANALNPDPMENLYLDYLAGPPEAQVDGFLPSSFPSPFPDNGGIELASGDPTPEFGGNRKVDLNEFDVATAGLSGSISGGTISVIEKKWNKRVRNKSGLNKMMAGNAAGLASRTDGHVYLNGTEANPIILNGDTAIHGDLIISGYVKGKGSLRVSGNVYMPGDVKYVDGADVGGHRTFGVSGDGTQNTMAIASGGNVMIGDFYRAAWGEGKPTNGWGSGSFNFIMEEMSAFNRMEWMKSKPTLPGESVHVKTGENVWYETKDKYRKEYYWQDQDVFKWVKTGKRIKKTKYKWITKNNGKPAPYYESWSVKVKDYDYWVDEKVKVKTGTKRVKKHRWVKTGETYQKEHVDEIWEWQTPQHENPYFKGANYFPRYYSFRPNSYVAIANKDGHFDPDSHLWIADELIKKWDSRKLNYGRPTNGSDPMLFNADGTPKAAVSSVTPSGRWIDDKRMQELLKRTVSSRDKQEDFEIDATIYSNNSIFGMVAKDDKAKTNGRLLVNGLVVAADVGLLAPEGTQVNYDPRGRELIDIASDSQLTIRRHLRTPLP